MAYERRLEDLQKELQMVSKVKMEIEVENNTLKRTFKNKEEELKNRQSKYEVPEMIISISKLYLIVNIVRWSLIF